MATDRKTQSQSGGFRRVKLVEEFFSFVAGKTGTRVRDLHVDERMVAAGRDVDFTRFAVGGSDAVDGILYEVD